ncbi:RNA polymerase-associated protein RTF1 homolog [Drosophila navojoa]|uniref:RNA polymerase-associated protein RTF1 homolog n=1 Tax=Drosophila navojoa TaxID=7232 RepID=UPI0011BE06B3|nr:RNA polymerase-associated protein RTF1 homolog [Drosophila navojoa]
MLGLQTRKRHLNFTEVLDEGELPDTDAKPSKFDDGYDVDLLGDAVDRERLESLSELDRETELYKRSLKREKLLYQWGIECALLAKDKTDNARNNKKTKLDYGYQEQEQKREQELEQHPQSTQQLQQEAKLLIQIPDQSDQAKDDPLKHGDAKELKLKTKDFDESDDEKYMDASNSSRKSETFVNSLAELSAQPPPSVHSINRKEKGIKRALNYRFTKSDAELMVQVKRTSQMLVSAAYRKARLIIERNMAVDSNDVEKVNELDKLIKQINEQSFSEHQRKKRVKCLKPVTRTKPTEKFDCQQYKKFAQLNSLQLMQQMRKPIVLAEKISKEKLDMYELHNFEVNFDLSSLKPFGDICQEIEGMASEPIVQYTNTRTCTGN